MSPRRSYELCGFYRLDSIRYRPDPGHERESRLSSIYTSTLACGLKVLVEPMPGLKSVGVSWQFDAGTSAEPTKLAGLASVISEMLLRGGGERDSKRFADDLDRIGATRSVDCAGRTMHIRSAALGDKLSDVLPMITDIVLRPRFDLSTLEPSKELALQGLESLEDDPRERASIQASTLHFPAPYNRSTYGSEAGINAITIEDVNSFWQSRALPSSSVIAIAGDVDPDQVATQMNELTAGWRDRQLSVADAGEPKRGASHIDDDSNQVQILLLADAPPESNERAALLTKVAVNVLSGGMSGRLFTKVREERGLCYTVSSSYRGDDKFGVLTAYVGTTPERAQESLDVLTEEMHRICTPKGRITEAEFHRAKAGMKSGVVFHSESSSGRASGLTGDMRRLGRARSLDEILRNLESVTIDEVNAYLAGFEIRGVTLQTLGPKELIPPASLGV
jgi:predicted Zn-dependent peptidase